MVSLLLWTRCQALRLDWKYDDIFVRFFWEACFEGTVISWFSKFKKYLLAKWTHILWIFYPSNRKSRETSTFILVFMVSLRILRPHRVNFSRKIHTTHFSGTLKINVIYRHLSMSRSQVFFMEIVRKIQTPARVSLWETKICV